MHWDTWIGPAPYRDYHADLHPHEWHGWYDFGNGSLGNMVLPRHGWDLLVVEDRSSRQRGVGGGDGGTDERCPVGSRIRWDCPARGDMPPVKVYWYDGYQQASAGR